MTINQVQCDGCGSAADRQEVEGIMSVYYILPKNWVEIKGKDLCPTCVEKVEEFIQGLKV